MNTPQRSDETPLFARYFDFMVWLLPCLASFPRSQRFLLGSRMLDTAYACHASLVTARKVTGTPRADILRRADVQLETVRLQLRLAHELRCVTTKQYEHGANLVDEIGRMLGRWRQETGQARA